jgi:uncharacterized protein YjbJ (UPF0337 family)
MSKADEIKGRVKQATGDLTGNERLKREGAVDKAAGKLKGAVDKVTDKVHDASAKVAERSKD